MPSFNGETLLITLDSGVTEIDAEIDLYKPWKQWVLQGNMRYPQAFRTIGGDALSSTVDAGAYFFLRNDNGWRIKPPEEDISIYVTGNLAPQVSTLPVLLPTDGAYTAGIFGLQPVTQNVDSIIDEQTAHVLNLQRLIESQRASHSAFGDVYYWDPYGGNDTNDGTTPDEAFKTFTAAHDAVTDNNNDVIFGIAGDPSGLTYISESITITKSDVYLRGPGRNFIFKPTSTPATSGIVNIEGNGVGVTGFNVNGSSVPGPTHGVVVKGDNALVDNITSRYNTHCGLLLDGCSDSELRNCYITENNVGVTINGDVTHSYFKGLRIDGNDSHGIEFKTSATTSEFIIEKDTIIHGNNGFGIKIGIGVQDVIIRDDTFISGNLLGAVDDNGEGTQIQATLDVVSPRLQRLIEGLRPHHTGTGNVYYWDPFNGDDSYNGLAADAPVKTFARAHDLADDNNHDIIMCIAGNPTDVTIADEAINITKTSISHALSYPLTSKRGTLHGVAVAGTLPIFMKLINTDFRLQRRVNQILDNFDIIKPVFTKEDIKEAKESERFVTSKYPPYGFDP